MILLRNAHARDAAAIASIYSAHVAEGFGTFEETAPDAEEMGGRMQSVCALGLPFLLAQDGQDVVGFAYASPFRLRSAYRYAAEDSIYVAGGAQGRGIGRLLLTRLIADCETLGLRQLAAVIGDSANTASIRLHQSLGFVRSGELEAIGFKKNRWLDVVFMQRSLNDGARTPPDGPGLRI